MIGIWVRALTYMVLIGGGWLIVLPACLLMVEQGAATPALRPWPWPILGAATLLAGVSLAIWAGVFLIQRGEGTPFPLDPTRKLVVVGPYRFVRNPQSIAMTLMVLGEMFAIQSRWLWVMLPATIAYLELLVGPLEDRQLVRDFGQSYLDYRSQVPKWIPRWPGRSATSSS